MTKTGKFYLEIQSGLLGLLQERGGLGGSCSRESSPCGGQQLTKAGIMEFSAQLAGCSAGQSPSLEVVHVPLTMGPELENHGRSSSFPACEVCFHSECPSSLQNRIFQLGRNCYMTLSNPLFSRP